MIATAAPGLTVDLNSDLGEGFGVWRLGDDQALLDVVTSANVACGFHAGDPVTMQRVCGWAAERGVAIGAQVSYRDLAGFGRRFVDVEPAELTADVVYQLGALAGFAAMAGTGLAYVKPHGALYNAIVGHEDQAAAVVAAVRLFDPDLPVLGLPGSTWLRQADGAGLRPVPEAFADRAYQPDGTPVSRREPGALLSDAATVAERCVRIVRDSQLDAVDGSTLSVHAASICVHGDTPGALEMARAVRTELERSGVRIAPFTEPVSAVRRR